MASGSKEVGSLIPTSLMLLSCRFLTLICRGIDRTHSALLYLRVHVLLLPPIAMASDSKYLGTKLEFFHFAMLLVLA